MTTSLPAGGPLPCGTSLAAVQTGRPRQGPSRAGRHQCPHRGHRAPRYAPVHPDGRRQPHHLCGRHRRPAARFLHLGPVLPGRLRRRPGGHRAQPGRCQRGGHDAGQEGAAVTALATRADGAIVDSGGTFYVFAGGRAFGISSPAALAVVRAADRAKPLSGAVGGGRDQRRPRQRRAAERPGQGVRELPGRPVPVQDRWPSSSTTAMAAPPLYQSLVPAALSVVSSYSGP